MKTDGTPPMTESLAPDLHDKIVALSEE